MPTPEPTPLAEAGAGTGEVDPAGGRGDGGRREEPGWFPELERFKAVAIVAVVLVHAARPWWFAGRSHFERWAELATMFGVPCFLFCSGFLHNAGAPVGWAQTRRRLGRLLAPYLIASCLAQLFRMHVLHEAVVSPVRELLLGDAFGAYYYVFVIVTLTLFVPVLSRLPRPLFWLLAGVLFCTGAVRSLAQWMPEIERELLAQGRAAPGDFRLAVRHPLLTWGYFMAGWAARFEYGRLVAWLAPRRRGLGAALWGVTAAVLGALAFADVQRWMFLSYPLVYLVLGALVLSGFGRGVEPGPLTDLLARHTYVIYLYHLFGLLWAQQLWPQPHQGFSAGRYAVHFAAGLLGPLVLALLARRLLPAPLWPWLGMSAERRAVASR